MLRFPFRRARVCSPGSGGSRFAALVAPLLGGAALWTGGAFAAPIDLHDVRQNLFATCMVGDTGWMVGELGRILRTTDGGKTWDRQDAGTKRPFLALACVDAQAAWISGTLGMTYKTVDGGKNWTKITTGGERHIFTLQFATPQRGHGAGDYGSMIHTEDGGQTWTKQQVPTDVKLPETALDTGVDPGDVNVYGLSFGDADHAWLVGEFGIVLASADGGRTWTQQHAPVEATLFGVRFVSAQRGWAVGSDATILRTQDGGVTWTPQHSPIAALPLFDVSINGDTGWIVGEAGTLLKSNDGGATWAVEPVPIQLAARWIRSVWIAPNQKGLAVGAEGLVFRLEGTAAQRLAARDDERGS